MTYYCWDLRVNSWLEDGGVDTLTHYPYCSEFSDEELAQKIEGATRREDLDDVVQSSIGGFNVYQCELGHYFAITDDY